MVYIQNILKKLLEKNLIRKKLRRQTKSKRYNFLTMKLFDSAAHPTLTGKWGFNKKIQGKRFHIQKIRNTNETNEFF